MGPVPKAKRQGQSHQTDEPDSCSDESNAGGQAAYLRDLLGCVGQACKQFFLASGKRGPHNAAIEHLVDTQHLDGANALGKCAFNELKVSDHVSSHLPRQ
jgi:hypothetical protein